MPPSELLQKQWKFSRMVHELMGYAYRQGYELKIGDAFRDPRVPYGHPNSLHKMYLAIDLLLFIDGEYIKDSERYQPLGDFWKELGGTWGGDFMKMVNGKLEPDRDGNHFSLSFGGMR